MPRLPAIVAAVTLMVGAAACSDAPSKSAVATVYPLAWIVEEVAPTFEVTSLAARGQDPHDLELTPGQRGAVEQAGVVLYLGDIGFQPQVEAAVASANGQVVSAAEVVGDDALLRTADGDEVDPHLWFDAARLAEVAEAAGAAAAAADPANADTYRSNAASVVERLQALDAEVERLLATCRHERVIVGHEAFAYLLDPHGLEQHGISGAGGHTEASPQDISELAAQIQSEGLPAVLAEQVEGRADAQVVAREAGVDVIDVSSLDIVTPEQASRGFPALLLDQAKAVAQAAACEPGAA